eukprot:TRINITY_DN12829_c0_g1_i2.p1 TRINITY_DN12829_c0_g1~~TRINITY_DN12829_c0_g1_i2.p1  ORF type:complete len:277 (+),score=52.13 TRINITY_DN12829_c0_g1_i2:202-1032(+)
MMSKSNTIMALVALVAVAHAGFPTWRINVIYNGHEADFAGFASKLAAHPGSVNYASLYSYTIEQPVTANFTLPKVAFATNFTRLVQAITPKVYVTPVIQMGGSIAEATFSAADTFASVFGDEADKYNYDGYVIDCQISSRASAGTQTAMKNFLNAIADRLHSKGRYLGVITREDFSKKIISTSRVDGLMSYNYGGGGVAYLKELTGKYHNKSAPVIAWHSTWPYNQVFQLIASYPCYQVGFWMNNNFPENVYPYMKMYIDGHFNATQSQLEFVDSV